MNSLPKFNVEMRESLLEISECAVPSKARHIVLLLS